MNLQQLAKGDDAPAFEAVLNKDLESVGTSDKATDLVLVLDDIATTAKDPDIIAAAARGAEILRSRLHPAT